MATFTIQDLKENRQQVIDTVTEVVGVEKLKEVMDLCVKFLGYRDIRSTDIVSYVKEVINLNGIEAYVAPAKPLHFNGEVYTNMGDYNTARAKAYSSIR